jgi:hypothetical protein
MSKKSPRPTKRERKGQPRRPGRTQLVGAFKLANPYALGTSLGRDLLNCAVASCSGAATLRSLGLDARPVLCSAVAWLGDSVTQTGHTEESAYQATLTLMSRLGREPMTRDQFAARWERHHGAEYPHHVIIQTTAPGEPAVFIDPTAAQLGAGTGLRVPLQVSWSGTLSDGRFIVGDGVLEYGPCAHAEHVERKYLSAIDEALARNYAALMQMALEARLDPSAFREAAVISDPEATARVDQFMAAVAAQYGVAW